MRTSVTMLEPDHRVNVHSQMAISAEQITHAINRITHLNWEQLDGTDLIRIAHAYYYFSIQFRENLEIACALHPFDAKLQTLRREECQTDNLSPWIGVAQAGEKLNHDEFMRRLLLKCAVRDVSSLEDLGNRYLTAVRSIEPISRAKSIASYEDGGLKSVFTAILKAPDWRGVGQRGFRFFLEQHIKFDGDGDCGHGALSRHLRPDRMVLVLWNAFEELLIGAAPQLLDSIC